MLEKWVQIKAAKGLLRINAIDWILAHFWSHFHCWLGRSFTKKRITAYIITRCKIIVLPTLGL